MRIQTPLHLLLFLILAISCAKIENKQQKTEPAKYQEKYRPQYHFTPASGWMNDPNGMVYYAGEYHLFYQHNPDSTVWGPMHWGHAVSKDLINWTHLPIAIYPDSLGTIFSGSAVVDQFNTSGLGTTNNPPLVAIYTYHDAEKEKQGSTTFQNQGIAFSLDSGRNWLKYKGNPILKNPGIKDFRDPKVSWHHESQKWIMSLAVKDKISFYSSPDLLNWNFESDFGQKIGAHGGVWECPDLFPLDFEGEEKWVLLVSINPGGPNGGSATQYFIGDFDGKEFTTDQHEVLWVDYGTDNYAGVTWSNVNDRKLFLGWMSNWLYGNIVPTENWRSAMTMARELSLLEVNGKLRLINSPIENYKTSLQEKSYQWETIEQDSFLIQQASAWTTFSFTKNPLDSQLIEINYFNEAGEELVLTLNFEDKEASIDRSLIENHNFSKEFKSIQKAPLNISSNPFTVEIYKDASSLEIFINDGELSMSTLYFSKKDLNRIKVTSNNTMTANVRAADFNSIW